MADETKDGGSGKGATATAPKATGSKGGAGGGASGKAKDKAPAAAVDHAPKAVEGTPRLQEYYLKTIRPHLAKEFGLGNEIGRAHV